MISISQIHAMVEKLETELLDIQDESYKLYIAGIALGKLADKLKKESKEGFQRYYDEQGEIPFYDVRKSQKRTYDFSASKLWADKKSTIEIIEEQLKMATDMLAKGITPVDTETGELLPTVPVSYAEVYTVTKKK